MNGIEKNGKTLDLTVSSSSADYDVIIITETWLEPSINNQVFISDEFSIYRKDRCISSVIIASKGGGVLIAVRNSICCEEIQTNEMKDLEAECIKIPVKTGFIFIYVMYIQPHATIDIYRLHLNAVANLGIGQSDSILIFGDFNLNGVQWIDNEENFDYIPMIGESECRRSIIAREVTDFFMKLNMSQICNFKNNWNNVLDLVYTNIPESSVVCTADFPLLPSCKSDKAHVPFMCTIECNPVVSSTSDNKGGIYCFRKANYDEIREHLSSLNIPKTLDQCGADVNRMLETFYEILHDTFERFIPRSTIRSFNKPKWHDKKLAHLKNVRNREYKKLCQKRANNVSLVTDDQHFISAKKEYEDYRKQLYNDYLRDMSGKVKEDPKSLWKFLNEKRKSNVLPQKIEHNGGIYIAETDDEKASLFASFFSSVYHKYEPDNDLLSFISNRNDNNCHRIVINSDHVLSVLQRMDLNKGSGHDGVSSIFLRECAKTLCEPLSDIFSKSIESKYYPNSLKSVRLLLFTRLGKSPLHPIL